MRVLITGATGFLGRALSRTCLAARQTVFGLSRQRAGTAAGHGLERSYACSVTDLTALRACVAESAPDVIYHLASLTAPGVEPRILANTNVYGTLHLLQAAHEASPKARVIVVSSSAVYGSPSSERGGIQEDEPFAPATYYGLTKVYQEGLAQIFFARHRLEVIRIRPFNMIGPGQPPHLALSSFARQIARIEAGLQPPVLEVGDLSPRRDFIDVRDVAAACLALSRRGNPGEVYNACSGVAVSIAEGLHVLLRHSPAQHDIGLSHSNDLLRPRSTDVAVQHGDATRVRRQTHWSPRFTIEASAIDLLNDWRERIRARTVPGGTAVGAPVCRE